MYFYCETTPEMADLVKRCFTEDDKAVMFLNAPFSALLLLSSVPTSSLVERGAARVVHCRAQRPAGGAAAERRFQEARLSGPRV